MDEPIFHALFLAEDVYDAVRQRAEKVALPGA